MGALPLFGFAFGRRDTSRLRGAALRSAVVVAALVAMFALPVLLLRDHIMAIFTPDLELQNLGARILLALLVSALFNGFSGILVALFQATGQTLPALVMSVGQGVLFIPIVYAAHAYVGQPGVSWAMTVSEALMFLAACALLASRRDAIWHPAQRRADLTPSAVLMA